MSDNAIRRIQAGDLRKMSDREGLILQGCGGDPQEWLDGINEMLADVGILRNGSRFERASLFEHDGHTNMLFDFEGVDLDVGKLAMWRLRTHEAVGGTWLSDYVPNRLGGFLEKSEPSIEKPPCPLIGQDGNIFNLIGIAARTLREAGLRDQAKELTHRIFSGECHSYGEALCLIGEYVTITDVNDRSYNKCGRSRSDHER